MKTCAQDNVIQKYFDAFYLNGLCYVVGIYILQFAAGQEGHTYLVHYLLDIGAGQNYIHR